MDLRGAGFGGHEYPGAAGMWARITKEANHFSGNTVISHETLARTRRAVIRRAVDSFSTNDVRVVLTSRDLGRQIPAVWQENVKNRHDQTYADFLHDVLVGVPPADPDKHVTELIRSTSFWRPQDLPDLVKRWSGVVGRDKVTLVTVPPPGSPRDELWNRFAQAVELPDLAYSFELDNANVSLGAAEAELLRRMTAYVPDSVEWPQWETRVKRRFAERTLAPLNAHGKAVERRGVRVIGDLDDLRPRFEAPQGPMPDEVSDGELLESALRVLSKMAAAPPEPRRWIRSQGQGLADRLREKLRRG
jgi:hypothetical protein